MACEKTHTHAECKCFKFASAELSDLEAPRGGGHGCMHKVDKLGTSPTSGAVTCHCWPGQLCMWPLASGPELGVVTAATEHPTTIVPAAI